MEEPPAPSFATGKYIPVCHGNSPEGKTLFINNGRLYDIFGKRGAYRYLCNCLFVVKGLFHSDQDNDWYFKVDVYIDSLYCCEMDIKHSESNIVSLLETTAFGFDRNPDVPIQKLHLYLRRWLLSLSATVPKWHLISKSGWCQIEGRLVYAHDAVIMPGYIFNTGCILNNNGNISTSVVFNQLLNLSADCKVIFTLLGYVFASFMCTLFHHANHPLNFTLIVDGASGSGKTYISSLLTGFMDIVSPITQLRMTDSLAGIDATIRNIKDRLVLIDDAKDYGVQVLDKHAKENGEFFIRCVGDHSGRTIGSGQQKALKSGTPMYGLIYTGEKFDLPESSALRTMRILVNKNTFYDAYSFKESPDLLRTFFGRFVHFLSENPLYIIEEIKQTYWTIFKTVNNSYPDWPERIKSNISILTVTWRIALSWLTEKENVEIDSEVFEAMIFKALIAVGADTLQIANRNNPEFEFCVQLKEHLDCNSLHIAENRAVFAQNHRFYDGFREDGFLAIDPKSVCHKINMYSGNNFQSKYILSQLSRRYDLVDYYIDSHEYTKKVKIDEYDVTGKPLRVRLGFLKYNNLLALLESQKQQNTDSLFNIGGDHNVATI